MTKILTSCRAWDDYASPKQAFFNFIDTMNHVNCVLSLFVLAVTTLTAMFVSTLTGTGRALTHSITNFTSYFSFPETSSLLFCHFVTLFVFL